MTDQDFLAPVIKRNTNPNGTAKDPDLLRRMNNPICAACHARYKEKYPGSPFKIICSGIVDEEDFKKAATQSGASYESVREVMDLQFWAEQRMYISDENGDVHKFKARDYQVPILKCSARRKVSRMGRGMGKTTLGVFEELHWVMNHKNFKILVVCPAKSQAQKWYDDTLWCADQDPEISESIVQRLQQPFYRIKFTNGSTISIFTAGSESGRGASAIRSQDPDRVRLEEQDGLNEEDYKPLQPLFRRKKHSTVHGHSTPSGEHSMFWRMCTQFKDHKEFHIPITMHPDWNKDMEDSCRLEAGTYINFQHEFMAEFGDPEEGVFKSVFIDNSKRPYIYDECKYVSGRSYFLGVDWNGEGTGMRARVVEFNPETQKRRMVEFKVVAGERSTTMDVLYTIRNLNRKWHCEEIYMDFGYGAFQAGLLRDMGNDANVLVEDDRKLKFIKTIDFGANLKTNKIISKRNRPKFLKLEEEQKAMKPFMVEGAVMLLENGLFEFSDSDAILDNEFRAYKVKTWSLHGYANTYTAKGGDHDLTATMLALMAIDLKYGLISESGKRRLPVLRNVPSVTENGVPVRARSDSVVSRQIDNPSSPFSKSTERDQIVAVSRHAAIVVPAIRNMGNTSRGGGRMSINSRTTFRSPFGAPSRPFRGRGFGL